jgi:hypothetical protein
MNYHAAAIGGEKLDPLEGCPPDIRQAIYETRSRVTDGICGVKECGQPLYDSIGCKEHATYGVTDHERMEGRAKRLGVLPIHHHRRGV